LLEQEASVTTVEAVTPFGVFPIVNTSDKIEQPLPSVIVHVYVPEERPDIVDVVPPFDQTNV